MLTPAALPKAVRAMSTAPAFTDTAVVTGFPSFLDHSMMSLIELKGDFAPVTMTTEWMETLATGMRSFSGS